MKHKRNLFIIFCISVVVSVLNFFIAHDIIVSSSLAKVFEILFTTIVVFVLLVVLYTLKNGIVFLFRKIRKKPNQKNPI